MKGGLSPPMEEQQLLGGTLWGSLSAGLGPPLETLDVAAAYSEAEMKSDDIVGAQSGLRVGG